MKEMLKKVIVAILVFEAKLVLKKYKPKIIAVTGSVGKTSTKDAIYTVLDGSFFVRKSKKSFNSEFGVPLTILDCPTGWTNPLVWLRNILKGFLLIVRTETYPQWLILEVGADRPGDIETISKWLKTDIVIITQIGDVPVHVEFFDSIEHLVREKAFLIDSLKKDGVLILNGDDKRVLALKDKTSCTTVTYGQTSDDVDVSAKDIDLLYEHGVLSGLIFNMVWESKTLPVRLKNVLGRHNVYSALAAFIAGLTLGMKPKDVVKELEDYLPPPGRMRLIEGLKGSTVIDDTYNASPIAVTSGLETLDEIETRGKKIAILGDMFELGPFAVQAHKDVGAVAGRVCNKLFTVGPRSKYTVEGALIGGMSEKDIIEFPDAHEAGKYAEGILGKGDVVFVKGSQGMRMEKAVEEIMLHPENKLQMLVRQEREWMNR